MFEIRNLRSWTWKEIFGFSILFLMGLIWVGLLSSTHFWKEKIELFWNLSYSPIFSSVTNNNNDVATICTLSPLKVIPAILMGSLVSQDVRYRGGTGHWYHMAEYIFPQLESDLGIGGVISHADSLAFAFKEQFSVESLTPFVRLLLTSVFARHYSNIRYIFFVWADQIMHATDSRIINNDTMQENVDSRTIILQKYHFSFIVDLESQNIHELFTKNSSTSIFAVLASNQPAYSLKNFPYDEPWCLSKILDFDWTHKREKTGWFRSSQEYKSFRNFALRVCKIPDPSPKPKVTSRKNNVSEPASLGGRDDSYIWSHEHTNVLPPPVVTNSGKNVLIYQRDKSRSLRNLQEVTQYLSQHLPTSHTQTSKDPRENKTHSHFHSRSNLRDWQIQVLVHSDKRSVCELIRKVSNVTVLLTPHGFQSILVLFQPLASSLIEIHPFLYFMPHYYGGIQSSLRHYAGIPRSYIGAHSPSHSLILSFLTLFGLDGRRCVHLWFCRYIARLMDVTMTTADLKRVVDFLHFYFP